ncbi:hypothetical protein V4P56_04990 [Bartonella sp. B35(2025)]
MNIRYFFIAGAITSGLSFALGASEHAVTHQQYPFILPFTIPETNLHLPKHTNDQFDSLNTQEFKNNNETIKDMIEQ